MKKYQKITIKVSSQTAFHLDQMSRTGQCSIGRVVDKLVRDRMLDVRGTVSNRAYPRPHCREEARCEED